MELQESARLAFFFSLAGLGKMTRHCTSSLELVKMMSINGLRIIFVVVNRSEAA